jgi:hypothetical protein
MQYDVMKTEDNWFISKGITRKSGENKQIVLNNNEII